MEIPRLVAAVVVMSVIYTYSLRQQPANKGLDATSMHIRTMQTRNGHYEALHLLWVGWLVDWLCCWLLCVRVTGLGVFLLDTISIIHLPVCLSLTIE
jgi:hypothetical protein